MNSNQIICFGCCGDSFFAVQQHDSYFSLYAVEDKPTDFTSHEIEAFLLKNEANGWSTAGTWDQVMEELQDYLRESGIQPIVGKGRTVKDLLAKDIAREDMTEEEHKAFVDYWYGEYERTGFSKTFDTPYEDKKAFAGQRFEILGRCGEDTHDLEVLPMWRIRFKNGEETEAYPEEICELERNKELGKSNDALSAQIPSTVTDNLSSSSIMNAAIGPKQIQVTLHMDEETLLQESGQSHLEDAISQELGWLHDSGLLVDNWSFVNQGEEKEQQLINELLNYFGEHHDSSELYQILHEELGMTHEDIALLGFDLPQCDENETNHDADTRMGSSKLALSDQIKAASTRAEATGSTPPIKDKEAEH